MLSKFIRKNQSNRSLDFTRGDGGFLRVCSKFCKGKGKNASEDQNPTMLKTLDILDASVAIRSKISLTKLLRMAIALLEIPVSGWTCLRTKKTISDKAQPRSHAKSSPL